MRAVDQSAAESVVEVVLGMLACRDCARAEKKMLCDMAC